ncbi:hypothetical protein [Rhizobium sp. P44RR-XXIV]|uniref:hypothetical protein n=1 Tax=Rhizobium sp. P44RR-XXIV TaxID=1921145 RepID=UPI000986A1F9|nr:hypothetical protein [Rhizobium sp. P44RR-XXIV]TIX90506.1 hypothetical protein BSK43_014640 [Rhizobium sp. P44RR-XXIV]
MFQRIRPVMAAIWHSYRRQSGFVQLLLIVPMASAFLLTVLVGNMGLALMGTAVALSAPVVGWLAGIFALILGKASLIIARDRRRP